MKLKGQENFEKIRISGILPKMVFLNDYLCDVDWFKNGDHATVSSDGVPLSKMDLRFLYGTSVSISSESESRAKFIFEKAKKSGAIAVAACHIQSEKKYFEQSGWCEVWKKENING